ncbi:hypothetical protein KSF78_0006471 [Schistosoma japonicum]|nr:hypothetical protein KSF78_0006471 [Schistosoma japonicum]
MSSFDMSGDLFKKACQGRRGVFYFFEKVAKF